MSPQSTNIKKRHSFYTTDAPHTSPLHNKCKSDVHILTYSGNQQQRSYEEYYKNYEHDEIPVKDDCSFNDHSFSEGHDSGTGDNKDSITNSDLDKLEMKILSKMSQELPSDASTVSSLDSRIKNFKITVQQIFDNFYNNLEDFELYKKKFNEILEKNKGDSVTELEEFINNMIQHIESSDSSLSQISRDKNKLLMESKKDSTSETFVKYEMENRSYNTITSSGKAYNEFLTNSTVEKRPRSNSSKMEGDTYNLALDLSCLEPKRNDRYLVSEINLREQCVPAMTHLASAENIKKLEAKKLELEIYLNQKQSRIWERNIPVKTSYAKKNIYLNEDFEHNQEKDDNKFFIFKLCSYLCKKLRRS